MSLLISSKSFFFLIYSRKPFLILGAAAVNDLSPVTKSAFGLNVDFMTLIVQSYFDTLRRYVLSVTFCGAVVMKVMDQKTLVKRR